MGSIKKKVDPSSKSPRGRGQKEMLKMGQKLECGQLGRLTKLTCKNISVNGKNGGCKEKPRVGAGRMGRQGGEIQGKKGGTRRVGMRAA